MQASTVIKTICAIGLTTSAGCFLAAAFAPLPARSATVEPSSGFVANPGNWVIWAFDKSGNRFAAGVGSSCDNAEIGAVYPANLDYVVCNFERAEWAK
jgi:hypothetical protein